MPATEGSPKAEPRDNQEPEACVTKRVLLAFSTFLLATATASGAGAGEIPDVLPEMQKAAYWVERHPEPDRILLTPRQIEAFNQKALRAEPTAVDPLALGEYVRAPFFLLPIEEAEFSLLRKTLYDRRGNRIERRFFRALRKRAGLQQIPERIPVRFGLIVERCDLRTFPTTEPVFKEKGNPDIDLFQETALHPGTPIAVLWESRDGDWVYLVSRLLRGWAHKQHVALFDEKMLLETYLEGDAIVVTEPYAPFYLNPIDEPAGEWVMGTIFRAPTIQEEGDFYRFTRPVRGEGGAVAFEAVYARKKDISRRFLPLTGRHILTQAFKLNGAPYGWGGLRGGWDCSGFLRDLFLTMGVRLPRNSGAQSKVGKVLGRFPEGKEGDAKKERLDESLPGAAFVGLNGHIMLYLGKSDDRHYVIHSTIGYLEKRPWYQGFRDRFVRTFRVLVSDMALGEEGGSGSLLERTVSVNAPFERER